MKGELSPPICRLQRRKHLFDGPAHLRRVSFPRFYVFYIFLFSFSVSGEETCTLLL
jgi:hypothetical protein